MTRDDIADYVGMTIETISRTATQRRSDGLIDIPNASDIVILNRPAMERIAGGLN
jgi:CRP-like cAMP-binding protein